MEDILHTTVDKAFYISDTRLSSHFQGITFSNYKKNQVKTAFMDALIKGKIEPACHWCAELICSGHFSDLWEYILFFFSKYIHTGNPVLAVYLEKRYVLFRNIIQQFHYQSELELRNHSDIRKMFSEMVCILIFSKKKPCFDPIKLPHNTLLDLSERMKAPDTTFAQSFFMKEDPREIFIPVNEFSYHISKDSRNVIEACYWIEWLIEFDTICKQKKQRCMCEPRYFPSVEPKFRTDIIWLLWEALLYYGENNEDVSIGILHKKIVESLLELFCIKYTTAVCKRRRYLLYTACVLICENKKETRFEIVNKDNQQIMDNVIQKIDQLYQDIKKNERSPNMEYLYLYSSSSSQVDLDVYEDAETIAKRSSYIYGSAM